MTAFITLFLTFFTLFWPLTALTQTPDNFEILHRLTAVHCKLIAQAPLSLKPIENNRDALEFYSQETEYNQAPDFGFLLGKQWDALSWEHRAQFNHLYTTQLKYRLNLPKFTPESPYCEADIRITETPAEFYEINPNPREFDAIAVTSLNDEKLLTYHLHFDSNNGWHLTDMVFYHDSLFKKDGDKLQQLLKSKGFDALKLQLEQNLFKLPALKD